MKEYKYYFFGIIIALGSSALDTGTYFIIRSVGDSIPRSLFPFISGIFTSCVMIVYTSIYDPIDFKFFFRSDPLATEAELNADAEYKTAVLLSAIGCCFGWMALEFMVIGLRISKSAIASYGEMAGITVPFLFDGFVLGRDFLTTDGIGLALIISLQTYNAIRKQTEAKTDQKQDEFTK